LSKAILLPSGDQSMPASTQLSVTVLTSDPSAFMTSISVTEFGLLANATRVPSGDQDGMLSHHPLLVSLVSSREFGSRSQISLEFVKSGPRAKAIRPPSGDHAG